jgi:hypothetical protein
MPVKDVRVWLQEECMNERKVNKARIQCSRKRPRVVLAKAVAQETWQKVRVSGQRRSSAI